MVDAIAGTAAGGAQGTGEEKSTFTPIPPMKMSAIPAWGAGMGMGANIAGGILEAHPDFLSALEEGGMTAEDFTSIMQGLMSEVTKSIAKTTDFLDELDDGEEGCAATAIFK
ncbi:MAG: hypothetical protein P8010_05660 [Desulfosarcinaceae bacterium]|jgi:hypothetical protein